MKLLIVGLLVAAAAFADSSTGNYTVEYGGSLTSSTEAITIHLPVAQARVQIKFGTVMVYSSSACDWRTERDGTLPTATAVTPVKLNSEDPAAVFTAFRSSDVGTAARTQPTVKQISGLISIDWSKELLKPGENITFRTPSSCTATYSVSIEVIQVTQ